ncbi:hypothetical protein ACLMJK_005575 [Lecanora helva]
MLLLLDQAIVEAVETLIQYKFKDPALLWEALQTKSAAGTEPDGNKRLAVVGDSVLSLCLAEDWYRGTTSRSHWNTSFQSGVGSNANLDQRGRALGLERFIIGGKGGKSVADTVEAILGATYLDTGSNLAKCKEVMDALDLLPREQRLERELDIEGVVMIDPADILPHRPRKRSSPHSWEDAERRKRQTQECL